jgi:hypothetical protein
MTKESFNIFWKNSWSNALPISHSFRHTYPERWLRIHSLPESKRYPDTDEEWRILLDRQNSAITEVIGNGAPIVLVTGEYDQEGMTQLHLLDAVDSISHFPFVRIDDIDLHTARPEEYEKGLIYRPQFHQTVWLNNKFNAILKDIAEDSVRVFFLPMNKKIAVVPYDGGIDFILEDQRSRDAYKATFGNWLSKRPDGL